MIVLGIETSCDETAAALVENGRDILASVVASQVDIHHRYGGVVPELASRKHIEMIAVVVEEALRKADASMPRVDAIAVTQGPGLIGSLVVGYSFAKSLAFALERPWVGVDHLQGHLYSVFLGDDPPPLPYVALLASGGHTGLYHVTDHTQAELLGQTRDDAAGEAYDKVAKMLGLGYPGGKVIDQLAAQGDPRKIAFPRTYLDKTAYDFSFSGLKTAVSRYLQEHAGGKTQTCDIAAGFQEAVVDVLAAKLIRAARHCGSRHMAIVGGVAANSRLRARLELETAGTDMVVHLPRLALCGDNAAMIAGLGYHYLEKGQCSQLDSDVYSRATRQPVFNQSK